MSTYPTDTFGTMSHAEAVSAIVDMVETELGAVFYRELVRTYETIASTTKFTITSIWFKSPAYRGYINVCGHLSEHGVPGYHVAYFDELGPEITGTRSEVAAAWSAWEAVHLKGRANVWVASWLDQTSFSIECVDNLLNASMDGHRPDGSPIEKMVNVPIVPKVEQFAYVHVLISDEITAGAALAWLSIETGEVIGTPGDVESEYSRGFNDERTHTFRYTYVTTEGETFRLQAAVTPTMGQVVQVRFPDDAEPNVALGPMTLHCTADVSGSLVIGDGVAIALTANKTKSISVGESFAEGDNVHLAFTCEAGVHEKDIAYIPGGSTHWVIINGKILPGTQDLTKMMVHIQADQEGAVYDVTSHPLPDGVGSMGDLIAGEPTHDAWVAGLDTRYVGLLPFSDEVSASRTYAVMPADPNYEGLLVEVEFTASSTQYISVEFGDGESPASRLFGNVTQRVAEMLGGLAPLIGQYWWVILVVVGAVLLLVTSILRR